MHPYLFLLWSTVTEWQFSFLTTTNSVDGLSASVAPTSAATIETATIKGTPTTFLPIFTVPASADVGANVLPNIQDPQAVDAQKACPGYTALNVQKNPYGLSAVLTLAGKACNVYGTDIDTLNPRSSINQRTASLSTLAQHVLKHLIIPITYSLSSLYHVQR